MEYYLLKIIKNSSIRSKSSFI